MVEQRGSIVPFVGWRRARFLGESPLRQAIRSVGDRIVRIAEEVVGQDIDARIAGIKTHPNEIGHDPFGFDPETSRYALAVAALLHRAIDDQLTCIFVDTGLLRQNEPQQVVETFRGRQGIRLVLFGQRARAGRPR